MEERRDWRSILNALAKFDSALVANTLDAVNSSPTHEIYMSGDIHSLTPTLGTRVGLAATCKVDTSTPGGTSNLDLYWRQLEAIEAAEAPMIWVVEAVGERPEHECVMGDGMAKTFCSVGCQAVVTGARVRDVEGMLGVSFAAYARHVHPSLLDAIQGDQLTHSRRGNHGELWRHYSRQPRGSH